MTGIRLSLYDDATDEQIGSSTVVSFLPYPGLRIIATGGAWEVVRVQVTVADPDSVAARQGSPSLVDAMVVRSVGVHHT